MGWKKSESRCHRKVRHVVFVKTLALGWIKSPDLRFEATNEPPYRLSWIDERAAELDYDAALARIARSCEARIRALRGFGLTGRDSCH